jgi:hypothetical protein
MRNTTFLACLLTLSFIITAMPTLAAAPDLDPANVTDAEHLISVKENRYLSVANTFQYSGDDHYKLPFYISWKLSRTLNQNCFIPVQFQQDFLSNWTNNSPIYEAGFQYIAGIRKNNQVTGWIANTDLAHVPNGWYCVLSHVGEPVYVFPNPICIGTDCPNLSAVTLTASPNPTTDRVYLHLSAMQITIGTISVFNELGQRVQHHTVDFSTQESRMLSFLNDKAGMYLIFIQTATGMASTKVLKL